MLKKLFFIALVFIPQLSFAVEVCVQFKKADESPFFKGVFCPESYCRNLPPPPSYYLPTITIGITPCEECFLKAKYMYQYRKKAPFSYVYEQSFVPNKRGVFRTEIADIFTIVSIQQYFDWELCKKESCTSIPGRLVINFEEGSYLIFGVLKKNCKKLGLSI